jgi:hypothetical protein
MPAPQAKGATLSPHITSLLPNGVAAGEDVCREVSAFADQVIVAARSWKNPAWASDPRPFGPRNNVSRRGMVSQLHDDGRVEFTQVRLSTCLKTCYNIIYRTNMC